MYYENTDELDKALQTRHEGRILVLPATNLVTLVGYYNNEHLIDSVVVINSEDGWEIIEGEKSRISSELYIAYFGSLIDLLHSKFESEDMFRNELLS